MERLRIDKWVWAARFFKTRSIAKTAIEGGKVHIDGQRVKVSREIGVGDIIAIKQGWDEKEIQVAALSDRRGPASEAQSLYTETERSIARRAKEAEARKAAGAMARPAQRPGKHERKALERLRKQFDY
ncbi:MAG: RNA-binding protein [Halieaceae bacterium MED-G27]|jgi:ribosome-associated heat shock protein Hsp15|nr:RNA-binding protein [Halieaceae bacterium]OUT67753.1 MAG: RNA-binding protein [Cellvibrionales bacterium TMED21]PDH36521.1 MAG: RNA-binding protein [Halieaceae bacterium MED-G27]|tara:strand:+ start:2427 stop:2810 length:384 start_codon:yes stop_codon:yes gene_type:complete